MQSLDGTFGDHNQNLRYPIFCKPRTLYILKICTFLNPIIPYFINTNLIERHYLMKKKIKARDKNVPNYDRVITIRYNYVIIL